LKVSNLLRLKAVIPWIWNLANMALMSAIIAASYVHTREEAWFADTYSPASYLAGVVAGLVVVSVVAFCTLSHRGRSASIRFASGLGEWLVSLGAWPLATVFGLTILLFVFIWSIPWDLRYVGALFSFNFSIAVVASLHIQASDPARSNRNVYRILWFLLVAVLGLSFFSAHALPAAQLYGDEVAWTDAARNWLASGQAYIRISGNVPAVITPGVGWWVAPYALWMDVFGTSLASGRLFMWVIFAVGVASVGWLGARLYHPLTGLIAALVTASSTFVLQFRLIRPEIALLAGGALVLVGYIAGRTRARWSFVAGLIAFLTLEFHASGIALIFALVLLHLSDALLALHAKRNPFERRHFAALLGLVLGAALYTVLHILIQPDPSLYFSSLNSTRGFLSHLPTLTDLFNDLQIVWKISTADLALFVVGTVALALRFSQPDRLVLRFLGFLTVGFYLFVPSAPTPGHYLIIFAPYYLLGVAAVLSLGFERRLTPPRPVFSALAAAVLCAPFIAASVPHISLNPVPVTAPSATALQARELASPGETVVGDFQAYWDLLDYPNFYASIAEYEVEYRRDYSPENLWPDLRPDLVFHTFRGGFDIPMPPLLSDYIREQEFRLVATLDIEDGLVEFWRRPE
jgi:hypothetical protein